MKYKFLGEITYKHKNENVTFKDIYYMPTHYEKEEIISYIKYDLRLVAGGGYSPIKKENIINFNIKQV